MLEQVGGIIFILSPAVVLVNAVLIGILKCWLLNLLEDSILTRALKVIFVPLACIFYIYIYFQYLFCFDSWWANLPFYAEGWAKMPLGEKLFVSLPAPSIILLFAICYISGYPEQE
ncbi:MAG: hypothetical protein AVO34_05070 [Firmicutes bacterium ML8_F2]|nr:MAG: hypothetical protein AVO34_05070 [Firmicutes bacterium ML8_F2]